MICDWLQRRRVLGQSRLPVDAVSPGEDTLAPRFVPTGSYLKSVAARCSIAGIRRSPVGMHTMRKQTVQGQCSSFKDGNPFFYEILRCLADAADVIDAFVDKRTC